MDLSGINSSDPVFDILTPEQQAQVRQREAAVMAQQSQHRNAMRELNIDYRKRFGLGEGSADLNSDELMEVPMADELKWREAVRRRVGHIMQAAAKQPFRETSLTDEEDMNDDEVVKDKKKRTAEEIEAMNMRRRVQQNNAIKKNNAIARRNPGAQRVEVKLSETDHSDESNMELSSEHASSVADKEAFLAEQEEENDSIVVPDNAPIRRSRRVRPQYSESMSSLSSESIDASEYDSNLGQFGSSSEYVPGKKRTTEMTWGDHAYMDDGDIEDRKFVSHKAKVKTPKPKYVLKKRQ